MSQNKTITLNLNCPQCDSNQWQCLDGNSFYGCANCDYTCNFLIGSSMENEEDRWHDHDLDEDEDEDEYLTYMEE